MNKETTQPKTVRTSEKIEIVRHIIEESPSKSVRRVSSETSISTTSVYRILRYDLSLFPYKVQLMQGLKETDYHKRLQFANWFLEKASAGDTFLSNLIVSDEASFYLSGTVNKQNTRLWGNENPKEFQETKKFSPHVTAWFALTKGHVIGPFFFEDEDGQTTTVTAQRYVNMLKTFFLPLLRRKRYALRRMFFQHDNATSHTAQITLEYLGTLFDKDHVISKNLWPPRSPDLTPLDFFLFGYLKSKVYANDPQTLEDLKENIRVEAKRIPRLLLDKVFASMLDRAKLCVAATGGHIQQLMA